MTKREKLYGWAIVVALSIPSIINGLYWRRVHVPGFFFFALAVPVVLIIAWLWIQERAKRK